MPLAPLLLMFLSQASLSWGAPELMPKGVAFYLEVARPSELLRQVREGRVFQGFQDLVPQESRDLLHYLEGLAVEQAALGFRPRGLLRPRRVYLLLKARDASLLRKQLALIQGDGEARLVPLGRWVGVAFGGAAARDLEKVRAGQAASLAGWKGLADFQEATRGARLRFWGDLLRLRPSGAASRLLGDPGASFFFAPLLEAFLGARSFAGCLKTHGGLTLQLWSEKSRRLPRLAFASPQHKGLPAPVPPAGTLARLTLKRDLLRFFKDRHKLFPPEQQGDLASFQSQVATLTGGLQVEELAAALGPVLNLYLMSLPKGSTVSEPLYPAGALVVRLKQEAGLGDEIKLSFQTLLGAINLDRAQHGGPRFLLETETYRGVFLLLARYLPSELPTLGDPRRQLQPCLALVGERLLLASHPFVLRALVDQILEGRLDGQAPVEGLTLFGAPARRAARDLKAFLVARAVLEKGATRGRAEAFFERLLESLKGVSKLKLTTERNGAQVFLRAVVQGSGILSLERRRSPKEERR